MLINQLKNKEILFYIQAGSRIWKLEQVKRILKRRKL